MLLLNLHKYLSQLVYIPCIVALCLVSSCNRSPYYQSQEGIPGAKWQSSFKPDFDIDIPDSLHQYVTYIVIRHGEDYPFSNLWLEMKVKAPGEKEFNQGKKIELPLADKQGNWLAKGMGGIWEHRIPISIKDAPAYSKPGTYHIQLMQLMRQDPLPSVMNVGIRVERIENNRASK